MIVVIYLISMNGADSLPSLASYKPQCHHSCENWMAYQAGLADVRLIEFTPSNGIKDSILINVGTEPLRSVRVVYSQQQKIPYVILVQVSKFTLLKKYDVVLSSSLKLNRNIADFDQGFVAAEGVNDGMQSYFVLATSKGQIMTIPVDNPANQVSINIESKETISSLTCKNSTAYLGTENGSVLMVDLNSRKIVSRYDTMSKLPIFNMKVANDHLIVGTCQGQLHITDLALKQAKIISAHQGMVSMLLVSGCLLYSVGDDLVLRVWQISKDGTLAHKKHEFYSQRPNLLFTIGRSVYLNFYEETSYFEI